MSIWRKVRITGIIASFVQGLFTPFFVKETPFSDMPIIIDLIMIILPLGGIYLTPLGTIPCG